MATNSYGEHFYQNKLLLDPTEASFLDLILFLVSSNIKGRGFIECHEEQGLRNFNSRWIVVISVLVQKILLFFRKPMAMIGNALEMWLNLLLSNGGFFKLLLNILKGMQYCMFASFESLYETACLPFFSYKRWINHI
jgi:hypothetical protein